MIVIIIIVSIEKGRNKDRWMWVNKVWSRVLIVKREWVLTVKREWVLIIEWVLS